MSRPRRAWLLAAALMLASLPLAAAPRMLIYQPQRADLAVAESRWPALFAQVRAMGFDTLVVQWVAYGDAFRSVRERAWLERRLRDARAARLRLILGLGADPDFFQRQKAAPDVLRRYLQGLERGDLALARDWRQRLGAGVIDGWYLALEVDDLRWRDPDARAVLLAHLGHEARALQAVQRGPVYLSSFFAGHMAPDNYARMLAQIRQARLRVWVQDGAGTGRLTAAERGLYLASLQRCREPVAQGVVYELFRQVARDEDFAARPMAPDALRDALARQAPCGGDSVYFEMRYLPGMERIRDADRRAAGFAPRMHEERAGDDPRR